MKPAKISCGLGAIRRAQASGSAAGASAGRGGSQVSTTEVPCPGAERISARPPASDSRARTLFRRPVLAGPTRAGSKPIPSSETVTVTPPDWPPLAVSMALLTPAWAATLRSASPAAALSASTAGSGMSRSTSMSHRTSSSAADSAACRRSAEPRSAGP